MKSLLIRSTLILSLFAGLLTSCKEDINFAGDFEETPVIIGLLDISDTLQYVKVMRTFSGSNNSINVAQIPDSNYFQQVDVRVEEWRKNSNNVLELARYWDLTDTTLHDKEPGAFFSPDQKVYFFKAVNPSFVSANYSSIANDMLYDQAEYRMTTTINGGEIIVNGKTSLVKDIAITSPNNLGSYNFIGTAAGQTYYAAPVAKANIGNSKVVDCRMHIYINEYFNGVPVEKMIEWRVDEYYGSELTGTTANFTLQGSTFYNLIKLGVTNDPTINKRTLNRIELLITGGTDELNQYILVNQPSSSLAQNKPTFTNLVRLDGKENVIGIFSSRKTVRQTKLNYLTGNPSIRAIDQNSEKELCTGAYTGSLLFCSSNPLYASETYYCQ